jgi:hypothetical protein
MPSFKSTFLTTNSKNFDIVKNIIIKVNEISVGKIHTINFFTEKNIIKGTCFKIKANILKIAPAFNGPFIHPSSQKYPLDIHVNYMKDKTIVLKNVWINNLKYIDKPSNWLIANLIEFEAEKIL